MFPSDGGDVGDDLDVVGEGEVFFGDRAGCYAAWWRGKETALEE